MSKASDAQQIPWQTSADGRHRFKDVLDVPRNGCGEFLVGCAEQDPTPSLELTSCSHARCDYIVSGRAWAQVGRLRVEIGPESAVYLPAGVPHGYQVIGDEPLRYVYTYPTERLGGQISRAPADPASAAQFNINNLFGSRWAVADDFEPWQLWEPSKGRRGLHWKTLFDARLGGLKEMLYGTLMLPASGNYSPHHHAQPEIFYCLSGTGVMRVDDESFEVYPGVGAYVPKHGVHTIDCDPDAPLTMIWIYGVETATSDWDWTPLEQIPLQAQPRPAAPQGEMQP